MIGNINKDIRTLNDNIYLSSVEINKLKKELDTLKSEYAQSLVFAYKNGWVHVAIKRIQKIT